MTQETQYAGIRILEAMHEAVRYNATIFDLIKQTKPSTAKHILEFGAGDGTFISKFHKEGVSVEGVEKDPELLSLLQKNIACPIYQDIRMLENEGLDFIYTVNVLEHIENLDLEIMELRRVLRPDGTIFVFVPAFEMLWTSLDDEVGHVTRFTRNTLAAALRRGGFKISKMEYFDCLGFPAALSVRFMEKVGMFRYQPGAVKFYDRRIFPSSRYLDGFFRNLLGKNLVAVAHKESGTS